MSVCDVWLPIFLVTPPPPRFACMKKFWPHLPARQFACGAIGAEMQKTENFGTIHGKKYNILGKYNIYPWEIWTSPHPSLPPSSCPHLSNSINMLPGRFHIHHITEIAQSVCPSSVYQDVYITHRQNHS